MPITRNIVVSIIAAGSFVIATLVVLQFLPWWYSVEIGLVTAVGVLAAGNMHRAYVQQMFRFESVSVILIFFSIVVTGLGVIATGQGVIVASQTLDVTRKIFEHEMAPAQLILEVNSEGTSSMLLDQTKTYHISKIHQVERDIINVSVWNIGHQTAQNVTVGVRLDPQDANLYNSSDPKKCRIYECLNYSSNPVKFRAIESNGFYSMRTTLDLFTANIKNINSTVDLVVTMSYYDSKDYQELEERYRIIVE